MGHKVDKYNYLQIQREPETVIKEWQKLRAYLESGIDTQTADKIRGLEERLAQLEEVYTERLTLKNK